MVCICAICIVLQRAVYNSVRQAWPKKPNIRWSDSRPQRSASIDFRSVAVGQDIFRPSPILRGCTDAKMSVHSYTSAVINRFVRTDLEGPLAVCPSPV